MYLRELSDEEKKTFWNLANAVVMADGTKTEQEIELLKQYWTELENEYEVYSPREIILDDEIEKLRTSDERTKRIICFELSGLILADSDYSKEEKDMIELICRKLDISNEMLSKMERCIQEIMKVYKDLGEILNA